MLGRVEDRDLMKAVRSRTWEAIVDHHGTWVAVNPLQGCPMACGYCYLTDRNQTKARPVELASPLETVEMLTHWPHYRVSTPVALYTCTDVFAVKRTVDHLHAVVNELARVRIQNPLVLITKFAVPDDTIDLLVNAARDAGLKVLVYLSYSGLSIDVEPGIKHRDIVNNFGRLKDAGIPTVHYWRPIVSQNSTAEEVARILGEVADSAVCSTVAPLQVKGGDRQRLAAFWPELTDPEATPEVQWLETFRTSLATLKPEFPEYPVFFSNSCAMAHVLERTDWRGIFGSRACTEYSYCPAGQRAACTRASSVSAGTSPEDVRIHLSEMGFQGARFTIDEAGTVNVLAPLPRVAVRVLEESLGRRVEVLDSAIEQRYRLRNSRVIAEAAAQEQQDR